VSTALRVVRPGILATLQDTGRPGWRELGVPASGALDREALALANALAGNAPHVAAIEMLYAGATLEAVGGTARLALVGANARVDGADGSSSGIPAGRSFVAAAGTRVRVGTVTETAAAYLAVEGGFALAPWLGSLSTYLRGGLGGLEGRALRPNDVLPLALDSPSARAERAFAPDAVLPAPRRLRVMVGPQEDRFEPESVARLLAEPFTISKASDRTGLRLEGTRLAHRGGYDLLSNGIAPGSIQVPGTGQPVLLIADHPTTGGYSVIATVVSADLSAAGRLRIGAAVTFERVDAEGAARARREREATIAGWIAGAREVA